MRVVIFTPLYIQYNVDMAMVFVFATPLHRVSSRFVLHHSYSKILILTPILLYSYFYMVFQANFQ